MHQGEQSECHETASGVYYTVGAAGAQMILSLVKVSFHLLCVNRRLVMSRMTSAAYSTSHEQERY